MRKYISFLVLGFLMLSSCREDPEIDSSSYECNLSKMSENNQFAKADSIDLFLSSYEDRLVGYQVYLRDRNGAEFTNAYGYSDIPNKIKFQDCHKLMVGSVSKMFTAVVIMKLVEDGKLGIDDPISNYIDQEMTDNIDNADQASIRNLLKHTSGIFEYLDIPIWVDALNEPFYILSPEEKLEKYLYGKSANFPVGERFQYSNSNYVLLGIIAERVSNKKLWELVQEYITEPLGLINTEQGTTEVPIPEGTARPYFASSGTEYQDVTHHAVMDGATGDGGIAGNMQDLGIFIEALFNGMLVSDDLFDEMTSDIILTADEGMVQEFYGLGVEKTIDKYGVSFGHGGLTSTFHTYLSFYPDTGVIMALSFNSETGSDAFWKENNVHIVNSIRRMVIE